MQEHENVLARQSSADIVARAERAASQFLASGTTALRCCAGCGALSGIVAVDAMVQVRRRLAGLLDIQIVAQLERVA